MNFRKAFATLLLLFSAPVIITNARANEEIFEINEDESIFAVVTKKEGVASGFAHDHLISASNYAATLSVTNTNPINGKFSFIVPIKSLKVDDPEEQLKHFSTLKSLGIQQTTFSKLSEGDRKTVREHMLSEGQLDLDNFPEIKGELVSLIDQPSEIGQQKFEKLAEVNINIKGKTVVKKLPASVKFLDKKLSVQTFGKYKFSEFGIKPYSALLGAVRNADDFHLYVSFVASKK